MTSLLQQCNLDVCTLGRKNNGTTPSHYVKAYGSVHRHIVQQLEKLKLVEKLENGYVTSV